MCSWHMRLRRALCYCPGLYWNTPCVVCLRQLRAQVDPSQGVDMQQLCQFCSCCTIQHLLCGVAAHAPAAVCVVGLATREGLQKFRLRPVCYMLPSRHLTEKGCCRHSKCQAVLSWPILYWTGTRTFWRWLCSLATWMVHVWQLRNSCAGVIITAITWTAITVPYDRV